MSLGVSVKLKLLFNSIATRELSVKDQREILTENYYLKNEDLMNRMDESI